MFLYLGRIESTPLNMVKYYSKVAITLRISISANDWVGMLYDGEDYYF